MRKKEFYFLLPYSARRMLFSVLKPKQFRQKQKMRLADREDEYSYKPFDQHRSIFIHIPKAAGVSICRSLFGSLAGGHTSMPEYQIVFPKKEFDRYFKFTFVRNPWDRTFSAYNFLKKGGMVEADKKWAIQELSSFKDFNDFVVRGLQRASVQEWIHFIPQSNFLFLPGNKALQLDFLGFFENIQEDFQYVKKKLGVSDSVIIKKENVTDSVKKLDYREFYTDEAREIVAKVYESDIKNFGYNFDNSSLPSQLASRLQ